MTKNFTQDNKRVRANVSAAPSVSRPVIANNLDITKLTGVQAGNSALNDFANRVTDASKAKATSLTLTINEANAIFANIAQLVLNNSDLQGQVFVLQNKLLEEKTDPKITISADGGGFK